LLIGTNRLGCFQERHRGCIRWKPSSPLSVEVVDEARSGSFPRNMSRVPIEGFGRVSQVSLTRRARIPTSEEGKFETTSPLVTLPPAKAQSLATLGSVAHLSHYEDQSDHQCCDHSSLEDHPPLHHVGNHLPARRSTTYAITTTMTKGAAALTATYPMNTANTAITPTAVWETTTLDEAPTSYRRDRKVVVEVVVEDPNQPVHE
jgi:hypothetical protein